MKDRLILILKSTVGLSLMIFIFSKIQWSEFIETIEQINLIFLLIPIFLFFFPGVWLSVLKWKKLLIVHNINLSFKRLYLYYLIGVFFNNFVPGAIGGDILRIIYLKRDINKPAEITASILMERFMGFLALIFLSALSVIFNFYLVVQHPVLLNAIILIFIILIFFILIIWKNSTNKIANLKFLKQLMTKINDILKALYYYRHQKNVLFSAFTISIIFVLTGVFATYLYFLSISIKVPIFELILIYTIVQVMSHFPITLNSIGITEGLYIILFGYIGISSADALTVALLGRVLLLLVSLSGGVIFIFKNKIFKQGIQGTI